MLLGLFHSILIFGDRGVVGSRLAINHPAIGFRRQCFIAEELGEDNLIFGSDYPHMDHKPDVVEDMVALEGKISQKVLQKILWDNPQRFYGLN